MSLRLVVVRHGITDWNREGRFQGHLDPPLSESGRHEARLVAERIASDPMLRPARIVSSSLRRATETAAAIAAALGVAGTVEADERLIEIGQGDWEGRTHAEIERTDPERYRAWRSASGVRQPPGGEPLDAAAARIDAFVDGLRAAHGADAVNGHTICGVSHGGALRLLASRLFDLDPERGWALDVDNASIGVATWEAGTWRLDRWNDTRHLLGREPIHVDEAEGRPLAL